MRHIVICDLSGSNQFFPPTLYHKGHDVWKKSLNTKYVLIFSLVLSEIFLILRNVKRDMIINLHKSLCKVLVFLVRFN
jgi:hypothetical protein